MNVARKLLLICVVSCAVLCSADVPTKIVGACLVQQLKSMGKLSTDFESNSPPPDPLICYYATELATSIINSTILGDIKAKIPEADCLSQQFVQQRAVFDFIKIRVIDNSDKLEDTKKQSQLAEARTQLTDILEKIVVDCPTDKEKFFNIFHVALAIKNISLEAQQTEYCLAKYTVENKLLELGDAAVWNSHNINPESVDCDAIVAVEKINSEREMRNIIAAMPHASRKLDCIMDSYRTGNTFNNHAALKVLEFLDLPTETKRLAAIVHGRDFSNFLRTSITTCTKSAGPAQ